ncbi:proteasomal ATPase-associated factor 1-like [Orbicella faveolata]|uniref:proteasomal ATPase-associated factor 1-like n=1 Tax=Orbicella faveolata TaxID=48498 RepID=UPI0009E3B13D|nr:proteasomal ATPase-associated factor 1-like [Orbicella faveolata]
MMRCVTHRREQPCLDSYRQWQIIQSDGEISSNCGKNYVILLFQTCLTLSFPEEGYSTKFVPPRTVFASLHKKSIRCIDVSPGGGLGVSSGDDGTLLIWDTSNGVVRHDLQGHISDVNTCRFFPSGKVVLSGGADLRLKIWSAEDGNCPVTLKGHTGGVVDTAIVDRGRNILSCSRDGTVRLWDCGEAKCLAVVSKSDCPVNSCALTELHGMENTSENQTSEREVGTEGKLLLLAKEDGFLDGVDVYNRKKVFQFKCPSAVNCCAFLSEYEAVGGTEDGCLWILDVRSPSFPVGVFRRSASPVLSLSKLGDRGFLASTGDGSCFCWSAELLTQGRRGEVTSWELIGPDCDPVYSICRSANTVYSACRDASIRKYVFKHSQLSS